MKKKYTNIFVNILQARISIYNFKSPHAEAMDGFITYSDFPIYPEMGIISNNQLFFLEIVKNTVMKCSQDSIK